MQGFKKIFSRAQLLEFGMYHFMDQFFGRKLLYRLTSKRRLKYNARVLETARKSGEGKIIPIERRTDLSLEEFKNHYRRKGIPVVMVGAAKEWDCVKNWSLEYFKKLHGDDVIALTELKMNERGYETTTLGEVIDNISNKGGKYYRFYPLLTRHPEHIRDFDYKWLLERKNKRVWLETWQVFIGGKDSISTFHMENQCNLFVQAYGKKRWVIYPDYYSPALDPQPGKGIYRAPGVKPDKGLFNIFNPDYETYPAYKYLDRYEVVLEPGDVLFNPCFDWHTVKNETDSISVGYRWVSPSYGFKRNPLFMFLDLIARNPPIRRAFKLYTEDTNLILVAQSGNLDKYLKEKADKEKEQKAKSSQA